MVVLVCNGTTLPVRYHLKVTGPVPLTLHMKLSSFPSEISSEEGMTARVIWLKGTGRTKHGSKEVRLGSIVKFYFGFKTRT